VQIVPSASNRFKKTDNTAIYAEVYAPSLLGANPPQVGLQLTIVDAKTKEEKMKVGVKAAPQPGSPLIPIGLKLPVASLNSGSYEVELQALDSAGNSTKVRAADFEVE